MGRQELLESIFHECSTLDPSEWEAKLEQLSDADQSFLRELLASDQTLNTAGDKTFLVDPPDEEEEGQTVQAAVDTAFDNGATRVANLAPSPAETVAAAGQPEDSGESFGVYRVLKKIAEHGQGAVYLAYHPHLNKQVVIKVSRNQVGEAEQQFLIAEGQALAALSHPNLAQVHDLQFQDGNPYLVMEYIEGRNLAEQLKGRRLSPKAAAKLIATLARALQHAHSHGIVHRDIKPANVVIRATDGSPRIIDFGLAQTKSAYTENDLLNSIGGTIAYMAPEQANGLLKFDGRGDPDVTTETDERVDIFALGAILFELLTGKRLYKFFEKSDGLRQAVEAKVDESALSKVPPQLRKICLKALAKDPADRWNSGDELANALQKVQSTFPTKIVAAVAATIVLIPLAMWMLGMFHSPPTVAQSLANMEHHDGEDIAPIDLSACFAADDALTFAVDGLPPGLSLDETTGAITGTLSKDAGKNSPYSVRVTATDTRSGTATQSFSWTVEESQPRVANPIPARHNTEGDEIRINVSANFLDDDSLSFMADGLPHGLAMQTDGTISGSIANFAGMDGPYFATVTATDGSSHSITEKFRWSVDRKAKPGTLDAELQQLVSSIADCLKTLNNDGTGTPGVNLTVLNSTDTAAVGLRERLVRQFQKRNISTTADNPQLEFSYTVERGDTKPFIALKARISDAKTGQKLTINSPGTARADELFAKQKLGNPETDTVSIVDDVQDVVGLSGVSLSLIGVPVEDRASRISNAIRRPRPSIRGTEVFSSSDSGLGIEIALKTSSADVQPLTPEEVRVGRGMVPFVPLTKTDEFVIHIVNDRTFDVAVQLTVDGLNVHRFHDQPELRDRMLLIPAGQKRRVKGWVQNSANAREFQIVNFPESAVANEQAGKKPAAGEIGAITAQFRAAWVGNSKPDVELLAARSEDVAVGLGDPVDQKMEDAVRTVGPSLLSSVTVRYRHPR